MSNVNLCVIRLLGIFPAIPNCQQNVFHESLRPVPALKTTLDYKTCTTVQHCLHVDIYTRCFVGTNILLLFQSHAFQSHAGQSSYFVFAVPAGLRRLSHRHIKLSKPRLIHTPLARVPVTCSPLKLNGMERVMITRITRDHMQDTEK